MSMLKKLKWSKLSKSTPTVDEAAKADGSDVLPGIDAEFLHARDESRAVDTDAGRSSVGAANSALGSAVSRPRIFIAISSGHCNCAYAYSASCQLKSGTSTRFSAYYPPQGPATDPAKLRLRYCFSFLDCADGCDFYFCLGG